MPAATSNNRTSPNCCPGTFSTSTGCVCTTENQRDFIAGRGTLVQNKKDSSVGGVVSDIVVEATPVTNDEI